MVKVAVQSSRMPALIPRRVKPDKPFAVMRVDGCDTGSKQKKSASCDGE